MDRVTIKRSTIFISAGSKTAVYNSIDEVPPRLRKKLHASTNGINAATILIADKRGREEIIRALKGLPNSVRSRAARTLTGSLDPRTKKIRLTWSTWLEILLPGAVGLLIWLAFTYR